MKIASIDVENFLNDLRNFNEIFRKDEANGNIKSQKNQGFRR